MILDIKATNKNGESISFDQVNRIVNGLDLSGLTATVNYIETTSSGSKYQNTRLNNRELALEVQLRKNSQTESQMDLLRQRMYTIFNPESNPIRFDFKDTDGKEYYLDAYAVHSPVMKPDKGNYNAAYQLMLLQFVCTDPYIYEAVDTRVEISSLDGGLEFDWEIPVDGYEFETKSQDLFAIVNYPGTGESGMSIRFRANGPVVNPTLINVLTFEQLKLNFTMQTGDIVIVETERGKRSIRLIRNNVETNIFYSFVVGQSTFLQLRPGDNIFRYQADDGEELLESVVQYRIRRIGV